MLLGWVRALWRRRDGSVTVLGALTLPALVGFVALVGEMGQGLLTKTENQRVADLAAYAAAVAYGSTNSTTTMGAVAQNVATLNGLPAGAVTASLTPSPRSATSQAVVANVSTSNMLLLAPVIGFGAALPVSAKAYAQINPPASPCVLALAATGSGISLAGGTSIDATLCVVASLNTLAVPCGTAVTAQSVYYNGLAPTVGCADGIVGALAQGQIPDPLAGNLAAVTGAARATALVAQTGPLPFVIATGPDIAFGYAASVTQLQAVLAGCAASLAGNVWTMTCPAGASTYRFGNLTVAGGLVVNFNTGGAPTTTYNFASISNTGTSLAFGPGTFNVARGIMTGGGSTTSFGAGTFNVGGATSACNGAGLYSVCNTGATLAFAGPSTFNLVSGLYNKGGSALALGGGSGNSFAIGPATDGNAVMIGGGAVTTFADATGGTFQLTGNLIASGGACTSIGAAAQHDINGNLSVAGGMTLGAGAYSVTGYAAFGASGGGDVACNGTSVGVSGSGVTFFTAGLAAVDGGSCVGRAFCVGSGFDNVRLSAPTTGPYKNLVLVGPAATTRGALFTDGASDSVLSGAVYFPNGPLGIAGGATVGKQVGQCLQLIASQISLSGGGKAIAASCFGGSSGPATATLVQ